MKHKIELTKWGLSHNRALLLLTIPRMQFCKFHAKLINDIMQAFVLGTQSFVLDTQFFNGCIPLSGRVVETVAELQSRVDE